MKVLLTGASSFTGYWFARELASRGHEVIATFQAAGPESYDQPLRRSRVTRVSDAVRAEYRCSFGSDRFLELIQDSSQLDVLCHHAAEVRNYGSEDFDVASAVRANTLNLRAVLSLLPSVGCDQIILTGSVFEGGEGAGSEGLPHFSPYGLSKALTAQMFGFYAPAAGVELAKFVIPNPFGPWEEDRFTSFLARTWLESGTPAVKTPAYVRDNIPVDLLARVYADAVEDVASGNRSPSLCPSGYVESVGAFTERFAREMAPRLGVPCQFEMLRQTEFPEPVARLNTQPVLNHPGWSESEFWDHLAQYYLDRFESD